VSVTLLFTDIEGSTGLVQTLGDGYAAALEGHRRTVRDAVASCGGEEIDCRGDEFSVAFGDPARAVEAARAIQESHTDSIRVRIGIHTGDPLRVDGGYVGVDVHRAARICAAGHGGQVLLSETTRALVGNQLPDGVDVHDLGQQHLKDVQHEHIYELTVDGRKASGRPLKTQTPKSRQEDMASRFEDRITAYVEQQLESAFSGAGPPKVPAKLAFGGAAIRFGVLLMLLVVLAAVALLIKTLFF
jgi:class 3 adenylate cyclase